MCISERNRKVTCAACGQRLIENLPVSLCKVQIKFDIILVFTGIHNETRVFDKSFDEVVNFVFLLPVFRTASLSDIFFISDETFVFSVPALLSAAF